MQVPLIGFIGRLDYQKGADLVLGAVPWLMEQDVQLVCLGTGDVSLEVRQPHVIIAFVSMAVQILHWLGGCCSNQIMPDCRNNDLIWCGLSGRHALDGKHVSAKSQGMGGFQRANEPQDHGSG